MKDEKAHFTKDRVVYALVAFVSVFTVQLLQQTTNMFDHYVYATLIYTAYVLTVVMQTAWAVRKIAQINAVKAKDGYEYHSSDIYFKTLRDVLKMSLTCMVAAICCGLTGIAGGMVLGPLFLSYGMLPQVMGATNQYITMISSMSVFIQFCLLGSVNYSYAAIFGVTSLFAAALGITLINKFVRKSGRQSVILIFLLTALIIAFLSLPIKIVSNYF
jgi:hypothetical protein